MVTLSLPTNIEAEDIEADEFWAFLETHLDRRKVRQLNEFGSMMTNIAKPLTETDSESAFSSLAQQQTRQLRAFYARRQRELINILKAPHDIDKLVFARGFIERNYAILWRLVERHSHWLNERQRQLLSIAAEDKEGFELWAIERILTNTKLPGGLEAKVRRVEENFLQSHLDFAGITIVFAGEEYNPTLSFLVENLYENVAIINLALFEQEPDSPFQRRSHQQDLEMMGYGKGRFEDETDEDIDAFLGNIQILRRE